MSKKIICFSLMILILTISLGVVSAEDNSTESIELEEIDENIESLSDLNETYTADVDKKDPDFDIVFDSTFIENSWTRPEGPSIFIYPTAENMSGNFTVYVDDEELGSGDSQYFLDPNLEILAPFYKLGDHTIKVQYSGDDVYNELVKNKIFTVKQLDIEMMGSEYVMGNDGINVNVVPKASGTVTLYINDIKKKTIKVTPLDDEAADVGFSNNIFIDLDNYLSFGQTYNVTVTFNGKYNGKTLKETKSGSITSVTYPIEIETWGDYEYGFENIIDLYTPKDLVKNNLNVYIDNKQVTVYRYDGEDDFAFCTYYVNVSDCTVGRHTISVNYTGDDKYPSKFTNSTFDIFAEIKISDDIVIYNSSIDVELALPGDAAGNLTVYLSKSNSGYEIYDTQSLTDGYAKINIYPEHVGEYDIRATYAGNYEIQNITDYSIDVQPIISYPEYMIWGDDKYITIKTDKESNGTLYFYRLWKLYKQADVVNGSANISLADLPIKLYYDGETTIAYENNDYEVELWEYWLTVKPKFTLTGPASMYYGDSASYSLKVYGANGKVLASKFVTIKIGSKSFKVKTNAKGIATFKVPNTIVAGKYTVKAIYNSFSTSKKLTVKQVLKLKSVKVKKSAKKLVLTATLKNKKVLKNKQVTFKFNGKTYNAKTNSKGIAKVTIKSNILKKLKVGKKITYQATYLKGTVKKTVKVQK